MREESAFRCAWKDLFGHVVERYESENLPLATLNLAANNQSSQNRNRVVNALIVDQTTRDFHRNSTFNCRIMMDSVLIEIGVSLLMETGIRFGVQHVDCPLLDRLIDIARVHREWSSDRSWLPLFGEDIFDNSPHHLRCVIYTYMDWVERLVRRSYERKSGSITHVA